MAKPPADDHSVEITRMLVARREFWIAVIVLIAAVVVIVLGTLYFYPEVLSEIVGLYEDDEPAWRDRSPRLLEPYEYYEVQEWLGVPLPEPTITMGGAP